MDVYLPKRFTTKTMYDFIDEVLDEDALPRYDEVVFDFTRLEFIEPVGITVLSNLIGRLSKNGCNTLFQFRDPDRTKKNCPMAFLDDAQFFKKYLKRYLDDHASLRDTTFPLATVAYSKSYQHLDHIIDWLSVRLNLSKESFADIKTGLKEIFNNINDHSSEKIGSVFIQHFPSKHEVKLSVSDFGVGIPFNIQKIKPSLNDGKAIAYAIQEGISTKSSPRNRGAGLHLLLYNVVINNQGSVYIHSNSGILNCTYDGNGGMSIKTSNSQGFYPGTLLDICFKTNTIENQEEVFSWDSF